MSSLSSEFAEAETGVFWDMVDCPIPNEVSLDLVCENIKSALHEDGYRGKVSIRAYCDPEESELEASAFKSSGTGIELIRTAGDTMSMLKDLMRFAVQHKQSNLLIISQHMSTEPLSVKHLLKLKKSNYNLLLAQIDDVTRGELLASVSSIWYWKGLSNGGKPFFQNGSSQRVDKNNSSEFAEAVTGVFWDVVDCEIPNHLSLDLVFDNIKSALKENGYRGKVSIKAYCDVKKSRAISPSAFKSSGIELVRAGNRRGRRNKMLDDILFFAFDHKPASLMVISKDISKDPQYFDILSELKNKNRNLLLAQVDSVTGELSRSVSSIWYWTDLAKGGMPAFQSGRSCKPSSQGGAAVVDSSTSGSSEDVANKRLRLAESTPNKRARTRRPDPEA